VSLFTRGVGGIVYWLVRRRYSVCPNCGLSWPEGAYALGPAQGSAEKSRPVPALPSSGIRRRVLGAGLALLGTALIGGGLVSGVPPAVVAGCIFGLVGTGAFFWGWQALQERRTAVRQVLEGQVLQLATRKGGSLTVTEVASTLDLSLTAAEGVLIGMDDGFRVRSDITEEGVLVYEFPEVQHRRLPD
jgi:hypothetical protein